MDYAFQFIMKNGGLNTEQDYPYRGSNGKCNSLLVREKKQSKQSNSVFLSIHFKELLEKSDSSCLQKNSRVVTIDGYEDVPTEDETALKRAVSYQPVSVAIEAGGRVFQHYQSVSKPGLNRD